jgi:hypothetical protein
MSDHSERSSEKESFTLTDLHTSLHSLDQSRIRYRQNRSRGLTRPKAISHMSLGFCPALIVPDECPLWHHFSSDTTVILETIESLVSGKYFSGGQT